MRHLVIIAMFLVTFVVWDVVVAGTNTHSTELEFASAQYWSRADAGANDVLDLDDDFTIECWMNIESLPSTTGDEFGCVAKYQATGDNRAWRFVVTSSDIGECVATADGTNSNRNRIDSDAAILVSDDIDTWVHLACTHDQSTRTMVMYKNGTSVAVTSANGGTVAAIQDNAIETHIGRSVANGSGYTDGGMDDARVWNVVRTGTEIDNNKDNCDLSVSATGLLSWWKFDNDGLDETSNNQDLTNNNTATFTTNAAYACATASAPKQDMIIITNN